MIDTILSEDDTDNDGFIDYAEFITSQRRGQGNPSGEV
jgi:Ca2+-binding EF-hand superfamily protein